MTHSNRQPAVNSIGYLKHPRTGDVVRVKVFQIRNVFTETAIPDGYEFLVTGKPAYSVEVIGDDGKLGEPPLYESDKCYQNYQFEEGGRLFFER